MPSSCARRLSRHYCALLCAGTALLMSACSDYQPPSTPAQASAQIQQARERAEETSRRAEAATQTTKEVLTQVGEVTLSGARHARNGLESLGEMSASGLAATRSGLEGLGQAVIDFKEGLSEPPAEEPAS